MDYGETFKKYIELHLKDSDKKNSGSLFLNESCKNKLIDLIREKPNAAIKEIIHYITYSKKFLFCYTNFLFPSSFIS